MMQRRISGTVTALSTSSGVFAATTMALAGGQQQLLAAVSKRGMIDRYGNFVDAKKSGKADPWDLESLARMNKMRKTEDELNDDSNIFKMIKVPDLEKLSLTIPLFIFAFMCFLFTVALWKRKLKKQAEVDKVDDVALRVNAEEEEILKRQAARIQQMREAGTLVLRK